MFNYFKKHRVWGAVGLIILGLLLLSLTAFLIFKTRNAVRQYGYIGRAPLTQYTVTISGEGRVSGVPDIGIVNLGVQSEAKTVKRAQEDNTEKMNNIITAVKEMGIEEKDLQTQNYNIYPRYSYDKDGGSREIVGYNVSQSAQVKVRDLDKIGAVLAKAGELGANQVGGVQFTIDDLKKLKEGAREKAIENAKEKADALFDKLGVKAGRIVSFDEYEPSSGMYKFAEGLGGGDAPKIEPGNLEVVVNVNLTYEIK